MFSFYHLQDQGEHRPFQLTVKLRKITGKEGRQTLTSVFTPDNLAANMYFYVSESKTPSLSEANSEVISTHPSGVPIFQFNLVF